MVTKLKTYVSSVSESDFILSDTRWYFAWYAYCCTDLSINAYFIDYYADYRRARCVENLWRFRGCSSVHSAPDNLLRIVEVGVAVGVVEICS